MIANMQGMAKQQYAPLLGQSCYTASCFKNFTDARDALANDTAALHAIRIKVLDALSLPSGEPGCAPLPEEQH
jgi:hypothetical protein